MSDTLAKILANKAEEVKKAKAKSPLNSLQILAEDADPPRDFLQALSNKRQFHTVIAECKKKSPSRGILKADYNAEAIACAYERGGAAAISVLTDEVYFGGNLDDLVKVKDATRIPVLRKDFIIDEYQIYEARKCGADTFLLLAGTLDAVKLQYFIEIGRELGMEPLVESHNDKDLEIALKTDAKILGINNRNLKTMVVDLEHSKKLVAQLAKEHPDRILICESGIKTKADMVDAEKAGFHGFLIGETLISTPSPGDTLKALLS